MVSSRSVRNFTKPDHDTSTHRDSLRSKAFSQNLSMACNGCAIVQGFLLFWTQQCIIHLDPCSLWLLLLHTLPDSEDYGASGLQYRILRQKGTEPAGSGEYNKFKSEGDYKCAGCGTPLYTCATPFCLVPDPSSPVADYSTAAVYWVAYRWVVSPLSDVGMTGECVCL